MSDLFGIPVYTSAFVAEDKAFLIDRTALPRIALGDLYADDYYESAFESDVFRFEMRMSMSMAPRTRLEPDPAAVVPARAREWPRWLAAIVAYEVRKAAGALRRVPAGNPRAHAIVTGLSA